MVDERLKMTSGVERNRVDPVGFWKNRTVTKEVKSEKNI
jgi:hypothetical protein